MAEGAEGGGLLVLVVEVDDLLLDVASGRLCLPLLVLGEGRRPSSPPRGRARLPAAHIGNQQRRCTEAFVRPLSGGVLFRTHRADELLALLSDGEPLSDELPWRDKEPPSDELPWHDKQLPPEDEPPQ
jgi:hypothetical protein